MFTMKEELRQYLKDEFEHSAFMADFGEKVSRHDLFDMMLRADFGIVWDIIRDCLERSRGGWDD